MKKPMLDIAYDLMLKKKKPVLFLKIWDEVAQISGLDEYQCEEYIADFYTDLSLDARFVHMGGNKWDLRSRHTYNEIVIDTSALLMDEIEDEILEFEEDEIIKEIIEDY